jgi:hypothetical protein
MQDLIVARILNKLLIEHHNLEEAVKIHNTEKIDEIATRKEELLKQLKLMVGKKPAISHMQNKDTSNAVAIKYLSDLLSEQILKFNELKTKGATEEKLAKSALFIDFLLKEIELKQLAA